jgi:hypothetical protein
MMVFELFFFTDQQCQEREKKRTKHNYIIQPYIVGPVSRAVQSITKNIISQPFI